ncbi:MAG: SpoIIE family protein phosphatase, partial [Selenomonadaceae bacterium]|nr:SpoIIE family protein phosphatase [Selenomonadaceae bacterium]
ETGIAEVDIDGKECFLAYAPIRNMGWSFAVAVEKEAVLQPVKRNHETIRELTAGIAEDLNKHMREMTFVMALSVMALLVLTAYVGRRVSRSLARPVHELVGGVREIAKGNLDVRMDMRTGDEIEELADAVNNMTDDLKAYMRHLATAVAEKERISTELSLARGIQEGMLPHTFPAFPDRKEIDLYASMSPAKEVGGDFYDFYSLDDHRIAITIADVSGKGIGAALFMVIAKTILKNEAVAMERGSAGGEMEWAQVLAETNHQLCESNEEMMFVTVFFGVLDTWTGEFAYVNGGHNPPLVGRRNGTRMDWQYLQWGEKSRALGAFDGLEYEMRKLALMPGDMLFLYTDGVTEAVNEAQKLYSEERLQRVLNELATPASSAQEIIAGIHADIDAYANGAEQFDDITMLVVRFGGKLGNVPGNE